MTNEQWRVSADALPMLNFLFPMHGSGSSQEQPRKLRLYFCALARQAWRYLPAAMRATVLALETLVDEPFEQTIRLNELREIVESRLNFEGDPDDLREWELKLARLGITADPPRSRPKWNPSEWHSYAILVSLGLQPSIPNYKWLPKSMHRADYVRDIFEYSGFDQSTFDSTWRTTAIVNMARQMYESHNFSAMPVLADLLEESGCQTEAILEHCRDSHGMHARGCWVIDMICPPDPRKPHRGT